MSNFFWESREPQKGPGSSAAAAEVKWKRVSRLNLAEEKSKSNSNRIFVVLVVQFHPVERQYSMIFQYEKREL